MLVVTLRISRPSLRQSRMPNDRRISPSLGFVVSVIASNTVTRQRAFPDIFFRSIVPSRIRGVSPRLPETSQAKVVPAEILGTRHNCLDKLFAPFVRAIILYRGSHLPCISGRSIFLLQLSTSHCTFLGILKHRPRLLEFQSAHRACPNDCGRWTMPAFYSLRVVPSFLAASDGGTCRR